MNATLLLVYFAIWLALAIGTFFLFRGKDPAFKRRWHRPVTLVTASIICGMLVLMVALMGHWGATIFFLAVSVFMIWVGAFQTRVCLGCGRASQPRNLFTPEKFCSKCGTALE